MVSDRLLGFAADRYCLDRDTLRFVAVGRDPSRLFYAFMKLGTEYILRIVRGSANLIGQTKAEMDWPHYLAGKGLSVSVPLKAYDGELAILGAEDGETYIISAYSKADGKPWDKNDPVLWNERTFHNWGKVMGGIHRVTKDYRPAQELEKRIYNE